MKNGSAMTGTLLQVAMGGALGAVLRYLAGLGALRLLGGTFPWGTLAVNVLGSAAIGLVWVWLTTRGLDRLAPLVVGGFLGGFTTFSAFSLDAFALAGEGRWIAAGGYVLATVALCLMGVAAGAALGRALA